MRTAGLATATAALLVLGAVGATADPLGNNGTVKVNGGSLAGGTSNDPHVGCLFEIDFFGYDQGAGPFDLTASATFDLQPPSGDGTLATFDDIDIGQDPAGGANDLDASLQVDLSTFVAGLPEAAQGFHVKLTVHAEGSQGADTKHKVFWVTGCGGE